MPFFAVRNGRNPGIYSNWDDCREQITKYPGAWYKKFRTLQEADKCMKSKDSTGPSSTSDLYIERNDTVKTYVTKNMDPNVEELLEIGKRIDERCPDLAAVHTVFNDIRNKIGKSVAYFARRVEKINDRLDKLENDIDVIANGKDEQSFPWYYGNSSWTLPLKPTVPGIHSAAENQDYKKIQSEYDKMKHRSRFGFNYNDFNPLLATHLHPATEYGRQKSLAKMGFSSTVPYVNSCSTPYMNKPLPVPSAPSYLNTKDLTSTTYIPPLIEDKGGFIDVYIDGAVNRNSRLNPRGGIGVWFNHGHPLNIAAPLEGPVSNINAELQAATRAVQQAAAAGLTKLNIHSDSMFMINSITKWVDFWKVNNWLTQSGEPVKIREELEKLQESLKYMEDIKWTHIRSHQGNEGNENADDLAHTGVSMNQ